MKSKIIKLSLLLIITASTLSAQESGVDCVYDPASITEDFLKNDSNIAHYEWDDKQKVANILLKSGDYVYIKKWACTSYGMTCRKVFVNPKVDIDNKEFWTKELLKLGESFLKKWDYEDLKKAVGTSNPEIINCKDSFSQVLISVPQESYPMFEATIQSTYGVVVLSIEYYMN